MTRKRRGQEAISIAFLDVITCGFGAIILLLLITKIGAPIALEETPDASTGSVRELQEQLMRIRGETEILNRDLNAKHEQIDIWDERVAILRQQLSTLQARLAELNADVEDNTIIAGELKLAIQTLTEEMQRLLADRDEQRTNLIGGIPVDSEYIIFLIDSSGSMAEYSWRRTQEALLAVLDVYPTVKGLQIINDDGRYMFAETRGRWMEDTPARRQQIRQRFANWHPYSDSSPANGIQIAIQTFYDENKKISLYVFGDDYSKDSVEQVVRVVERYNLRGPDGKPMVRIHGIGLPALLSAGQYRPGGGGGGAKYASLMRELTRRNGGAFVGLETSY